MHNIDDIYHNLITVINEITDIEKSKINWQTNLMTDLSIDSLDFLDITFALDKKYNIHLPVEVWLQDNGNEELFTVINICKEIEKLIK